MNRPTARCQPSAGGELESVSVRKVVDRLNESLPECLLADDEGAIVILESANQNLRRRCRSAVDERDDRNRRSDRLIISSIRFDTLARTNRRQTRSFREKLVCNVQCGLDSTARITAKIEHD